MVRQTAYQMSNRPKTWTESTKYISTPYVYASTPSFWARACAKHLVQTHIHKVQISILQIVSKFQADQTSNKPSSKPSTLNFSAFFKEKNKNAIITVCFIKKNLARACAKNLVQTHIHNVQRYILQILSKFQAGQTSNKPSSEPSTLNFSAYL